MTWIKICGITNLADAHIAVEAGADALGFVFYDKSPRMIDTQNAKDIVRSLPEHIEKVGVFVESNSSQIREIASEVGLTAVQLHGKQSMESVLQDSRPAVESVGVSRIIPAIPGDSLKHGGILINRDAPEKIFALLFDSHSNGTFGGTGKTFDWQGTRAMVQVLSLKLPVIVAGGLTALNVAEPIRILQPFGVDVSSGVESYPGKKNPEKIHAFIQAVRAANQHS